MKDSIIASRFWGGSSLRKMKCASVTWRKPCKETAVRHMAVHVAPRSLDWIRVRCAGQGLQPDDALRPSPERLEHLRMVIAGVVQKYMSLPVVGMGASVPIQQPRTRLGIDLFAFHRRELQRF